MSEELKTCKRCHVPQPLERFRRWDTKKTKQCRDCDKAVLMFKVSRKQFPSIKTCSACGETKTPDGFYTSYGNKDMLTKKCKACLYVERKDKVKAWFAANPGKKSFYARRNELRRKGLQAKGKKTYWENLRADMIAAYGSVCACCGEHRSDLLTLDHVDGDGRKHRARVGAANVYADLKRQGWPKTGYRLLCMNCNHSIGVRGFCPHQCETVAYGMCVGGTTYN